MSVVIPKSVLEAVERAAERANAALAGAGRGRVGPIGDVLHGL